MPSEKITPHYKRIVSFFRGGAEKANKNTISREVIKMERITPWLKSAGTLKSRFIMKALAPLTGANKNTISREV